MAIKKIGRHSFQPLRPAYITQWTNTVGKKEGEGPLRAYFDEILPDSLAGQSTWEQAEQKMQLMTLQKLLNKAQLDKSDLDVVFSGDLLNQCVGSSFALRNMDISHIGLYGACSTMALSLLLSTLAVGSGMADRAVAMTSSHFASSERQYRFPLGYGGQRTPTAQWTVTGCGATLVSSQGEGLRVESCTMGTVCDFGITDGNNMGSAMAPAACSTICNHLRDMNRVPQYYDKIFTGDLGHLGKRLLITLARKQNVVLEDVLEDCGCLIFQESQDVHAGGSGCGCSASVLCGYILNQMQKGIWKRVLFCATGALMSPVSMQQGLPIPGICHAVSITREDI